MLQHLSPEDVQKLRQARQAALADPAVQAARAGGDQRAFRKAMRETILRNDPSLAPVLAKMRPNAAGQLLPGQPGQAVARKSLSGEMEKRLVFLPEDERVKVRNAAVGAQLDPKLSALRQKMQSAPTPEEKKPAAKAYREELRNAMLRYDPSLAPILEELRTHRQTDEGADAPAL